MAVQLIRQGPGRRSIQKYGGGRFVVAGAKYEGSILILPGEILSWPVTDFEALTIAAFAPLIPHIKDVDFCLLGCGPAVKPLPLALRNQLKDAGLRVETMATGAACRTFNVLVAEGRALAAALISI
jgi:uncharacterized protein